MHKFIICTLLLSCFCIAVKAQELTKKDKKIITAQLKAYKSNPEAYKRMIDSYKQIIDSATADLSQKRETIKQLSVSNGDLLKRLNNREGELKECQERPAPKCPDIPAAGQTPTTGTIYKIQIGLFKNLDMGDVLTDPKYVTMEQADGKNRYVVSYFTDREQAKVCVADLKKMGIKGAFISTYENGERVVRDKATANK